MTTVATYTPDNWETGTGDIETVSSPIAAGLVVPARTPMAFDAAAGNYVVWDEAGAGSLGVAVRMTVIDIDTTGGAATHALYKAGTFNPALVNWPGSSSAAEREGAFVGTPISLQAPA